MRLVGYPGEAIRNKGTARFRGPLDRGAGLDSGFVPDPRLAPAFRPCGFGGRRKTVGHRSESGGEGVAHRRLALDIESERTRPGGFAGELLLAEFSKAEVAVGVGKSHVRHLVSTLKEHGL